MGCCVELVEGMGCRWVRLFSMRLVVIDVVGREECSRKGTAVFGGRARGRRGKPSRGYEACEAK